jgi:hypothetical protein
MGLRITSWRRYYEGVSASPQAIYRSIIEELEDRDIPGLIIRRNLHREGGIFSRKRWYLVVQRHEYRFRVSAVTFSYGIIISWYLEEQLSLWWRFAFIIPPIGKLLIRIIRPDSYARIDRSWGFQTIVNSAIQGVMNDLVAPQGRRDWSGEDARPILADFNGSALPNGR